MLRFQNICDAPLESSRSDNATSGVFSVLLQGERKRERNLKKKRKIWFFRSNFCIKTSISRQKMICFWNKKLKIMSTRRYLSFIHVFRAFLEDYWSTFENCENYFFLFFQISSFQLLEKILLPFHEDHFLCGIFHPFLHISHWLFFISNSFFFSFKKCDVLHVFRSFDPVFDFCSN